MIRMGQDWSGMTRTGQYDQDLSGMIRTGKEWSGLVRNDQDLTWFKKS